MNSQLNDKLNEIIAKCGIGGLNSDVITLLTGVVTHLAELQSTVDVLLLSQSYLDSSGGVIPLSYTPENNLYKVSAITTLNTNAINYTSTEAVVSYMNTNSVSNDVITGVISVLEKQSADFKTLTQSVADIKSAITGSPP